METLKFIKDQSSRWYIDLPNWEGEKADLEMVCGADNMLDIMAQGSDVVRMDVSTEQIGEYEFMLEFNREESGGAWYYVIHPDFNFEAWLCEVTKLVLGGLPQKIFIYLNH